MSDYVFPVVKIGEVVASGDSATAALGVGMVAEKPGKRFRLVQLSLSGGAGTTFGSGSGVESAKEKVFEWVTEASFLVRPCNAATDRVAGVSPSETKLVLTHGDLFWLQIDGLAYVVTASDGSTAAGQTVIPDDDTDLGKVTTSGGSTFTEGVTVGMALETQGSADSRAQIRLKLVP